MEGGGKQEFSLFKKMKGDEDEAQYLYCVYTINLTEYQRLVKTLASFIKQCVWKNMHAFQYSLTNAQMGKCHEPKHMPY